MNEAEVRQGNVISLAAVNGRKLQGTDDIAGYENAKAAGELYPRVMKSIARLWTEMLTPTQITVLLSIVERSLGVGNLHVHTTQQEMIEGETDDKGEFLFSPIKMSRGTLIRSISELGEMGIVEIHPKVLNLENGKIANIYIVAAEKLIAGPYEYVDD